MKSSYVGGDVEFCRSIEVVDSLLGLQLLYSGSRRSVESLSNVSVFTLCISGRRGINGKETGTTEVCNSSMLPSL
jgi:hypothetical protein